MENKSEGNKLDEGHNSVTEWEMGSIIQEGKDEKYVSCKMIKNDQNWKELFKNQDPYVPVYIHNNNSNIDHPTEESKVPNNLFGSRTYTSPESLQSSSGNSNPNDNELVINDKNIPNKSIASKLRSEQNSEKFSMLREVVEKIEDPEKRKILLNFIDQSTLKTEYVTIKESSSDEEQNKAPKINNPIRKRKSPLSAKGKNNDEGEDEKLDSHSQERKRYSLVHAPVIPASSPKQQIQKDNYVAK